MMMRFSGSLLLMIPFAAFAGVKRPGQDARHDSLVAQANAWVFEGWACAPEPAMIKKRLSPP